MVPLRMSLRSDAARAYVSNAECDIDRVSNLAYSLPDYDVESIEGMFCLRSKSSALSVSSVRPSDMK